MKISKVLHGKLTCAAGYIHEDDLATVAVDQPVCSCQHLDYPQAVGVHQVRSPVEATPVWTHATKRHNQ